MENQENNRREVDSPIPVCRCPYNKSVLAQTSRIGVMILGTVGLYFLNLWVAVGYLIYSVVFNYVVWPKKSCQYCYYKVIGTSIETEKGKTIKRLLPLEEWKTNYLSKHVASGKAYEKNLFILWLGPFVLIIVSFFLNFSIIALLSLLGFIGLLAVLGINMKSKVCSTCAFKEECFASL